MKYALVDKGRFTGRIRDFVKAPRLPGKPHLKWVPFVEEAQPPFDPSTHMLEPAQYAVSGNRVACTYKIREKTAKEIAAETEAQLAAKIGSVTSAISAIVDQISTSPGPKRPAMQALINRVKTR